MGCGRAHGETPSAAWRGMAGTAVATAVFAGIHSLLASRAAKRAAERLLGTRRRNALYRPLYLAQSFVTLGALWAYARRLPDRELYRLEGPARWALRAGQAGGLLYAAWGAYHVGYADISGLRGLLAWLGGEEEVPREAEAQGPALRGGRVAASGPFARSRHPLNLSFVPVFWLTPGMGTRWLAFSLIATAYLVAGSHHEEARLREAYGEPYEDYQRGGCPFFLPRCERRPPE